MPVNKKDSIKSPEKAFSKPKDVVLARHLNKNEKLKILKNWEDEKKAELKAEEENMDSNEVSSDTAETLQDISIAKTLIK